MPNHKDKPKHIHRGSILGVTVPIHNVNLNDMSEDYLYHIGLNTVDHDLRSMFGDIKFVVLGGTGRRMKEFAEMILKETKYPLPAGTELSDISATSHRYSMYKAGRVLCVSHGMGIPSISILLHELIKLMHYAGCNDPIFIRMGTCGGIGVPGGNLVLTNQVVDGMLEPFWALPILGKIVKRPSVLDTDLIDEIKKCHRPDDKFDIVVGKTLSALDFYEGQGRLDGAFCSYTEEQKNEYLNGLLDHNVKNIEMEGSAFAALTHAAGIKAAMVCVVMVNRLEIDQIALSVETKEAYQQTAQTLLARFIVKKLDEIKDEIL